jgi:large subunit ribosomal protein L6
MSRIGKKIITLPAGVEANLVGQTLTVKGPKGTLTLNLHPKISLVKEGAEIKLKVEEAEIKKNNALWGLHGSLIKNMVIGVTTGFERKLEMNGIGFKAEVKGKDLVLDVGYSHSVKFAIPEGISITMEKNVINIKGFDKHLVGSTAANIRDIKPPEPYQGKGIKYAEELVRRKAGKTASKTAA